MRPSSLPPAPPRPWILHVDLDQFLAAVEVRRRPELVGRPVIVGGDGDPTRARQVVATASYEARAHGVHSGMPLRQAARRSPEAVFLPHDRPVYEAASVEVMDALRRLGHPVQVWGWDEAYLSATTDDPWALATTVRERILTATRLSCSVGIGQNTLQAKLATGFGKPGGIGVLTSADWETVMFDRPVEAIGGIGRKTAQRLAGLGVTTVAELAGTDVVVLAETFGPSTGGWLSVAGHGGGATTLSTEAWVARSRSRVVTYPTDLTDRDRMDAEVTTMAAQLTTEVAADGRTVHRVAVTVRTASFFTRSKIRKLSTPTVDPDAVAATARAVLAAFPLDRPVRLLGVRVELDPPT
ncbi:MAG: DNA polymerase IV [Nakamurella sp.]